MYSRVTIPIHDVLMRSLALTGCDLFVALERTVGTGFASRDFGRRRASATSGGHAPDRTFASDRIRKFEILLLSLVGLFMLDVSRKVMGADYPQSSEKNIVR